MTLLDATYVSLATFRRNGVKVATPVWIAPALEDDQGQTTGFVFSAANAGKIKRLRNNTEIELAVCDVRGNLDSGAQAQSASPWQSGHAQIIHDPVRIRTALAALHKKYGWQMWLADLGAKLTGKYHRRAYIEVSLSTLS